MTLILPLALMIAVAAATFAPGLGTDLFRAGVAPWLVALIFLVNGYLTDLRQRPSGKTLGSSILTMAVINLVLAPFLGLVAASILGLQETMALGLILMAAMPPTLSSGIVLTIIARGDGLWALLFTIALNILGIISIPLILPLVASVADGTVIQSWPLFEKLIYVVLLPFLGGQIVQRVMGLSSFTKQIGHIPTACIALSVWMIISNALANMGPSPAIPFGPLLTAGIGATLVHVVLLGLCFGGARGLNLPQKAWSAFVFTGSQKTLPVAISVLATLPMDTGNAVLVCVLYHFIQLFMDSWIAGKWGKANP